MQVDPEEISGLIEMAEVMISQKPPPSQKKTPAYVDDKATREMDPATFRALLRQERGDPTIPVPTRRPDEIDPPETLLVPKAKIQDLVAQTEPDAPKSRKISTTAELMASVDEAFADFGPEVVADGTPPPQGLDKLEGTPPQSADALAIPQEPASESESKAIKPQALIVPDHRLEARFAGGIAPITKPPLNVDSAAPIEEADAAPSVEVTVTPAPEDAAPVEVAVTPAERKLARGPIPVPAQDRSQFTIALISLLAVTIIISIAIVLMR